MTDPLTSAFRKSTPWSALILALLLASVSLRAETNTPTGDRLFFRNGDSLAGNLAIFDSRSGIQWLRDDAGEPITFSITNASSIDLGQIPPAVPWQSVSHRIRLRGDDLVSGVIESCDSSTVRIATPSAGVITAQRSALVSIVAPPPPETAVYQGPTGLDGWVQGSSALAPFEGQQWSYRTGAFYAANSASIARDVHLPPMASIQFDLRWQSQFQVNVALYADSAQPVSLLAKDNEPAFSGFYSLQLNNATANLMAVKQGDALRNFDPVILQSITQADRAHVDVRVNTNHGSFYLLLNGVMVKEWTDPTGFIGKGTMLRFVNSGSFGPVKISNIRVTRWDGVLSERPSVDPSGGRDVIRLDDDSVVQGRLLAIADSKMTLSNAQGIVEIPLSRLRQLDFAKPSSSQPSVPPTGYVRVFFGQSSRLTLKVDQFDRKTLRGANADFEKVEIDGSSVTRLQLIQ